MVGNRGNPDKSTISLKGPEGRVFGLYVKDPDNFQVAKVGDQVLVYYTEAVAVSVQSATHVALGSEPPECVQMARINTRRDIRQLCCVADSSFSTSCPFSSSGIRLPGSRSIRTLPI